MKTRVFVILFLLNCMLVPAQVFELGGVTVKELEETKHPFDKDADAAYLHKKGKTYFDIVGGQFRTITEVEVRLKIYTKAGYEHASVEIPYYAGRTSQRVKFSEACTYNLVNGAIEKTKLKSEGKFEEEVANNVKLKKIILPNVKEGSVIEYKYVIANPFMTISDWYFQHDIPVNSIEYEVAIPEYFGYHKHIKGYARITSYDKPKRGGYGGFFSENVTMYSAKNIMALKDEKYVDNIENYMSVLEHEMAMVQFPGSAAQYFANNWQTLCEKIYGDESFGRELKFKSYFEDDLEMLLKDVPQNKKLDTIFSFVRDRMAWNEVETEFCNKGVKKAYQEKTGNSAEINLMLTAMLRYAGFDANPVLVSTRENGEAIYPSPSAFNYVVAGVMVDKEILLLDATSKNTVPGLLPVRALNWTGRMIMDNKECVEVDLMPKKKSLEVISITGAIDADGKISGRARDQYVNHSAHVFREDYTDGDKEKYVQELEKSYSGIEINDYNVLNLKELNKPVGDDYSFAHNTIADVIGDKLYFSPMLHFTEKENPFTADKREYPIDFMFPHQSKYVVGIKIPEGYVLESLPRSVTYLMEENIGSFKYNIMAVGSMIQANIVFDINYANIGKEYYPTLKDFFSKVIEKQNEKIILKKA
jgi:hypothetical protein